MIADALRQLAAFVVDEQPIGRIGISQLTETRSTCSSRHCGRMGRAASTRNKFVHGHQGGVPVGDEEGLSRSQPDRRLRQPQAGEARKRDRRLVPDVLTTRATIARDGEERRLLAVAVPHLQRLIIAGDRHVLPPRRAARAAMARREISRTRELLVRAEEEGAEKDRRRPAGCRSPSRWRRCSTWRGRRWRPCCERPARRG